MTPVQQNQGYLYTFSRQSFCADEFTSYESVRNPGKNGIILTLIADDHPYLIHGVEADLNKDPKIKIVGTAGSYNEVITKVSELKPDVILLDLRMPGYEKLDLRKFITQIKGYCKCKIIIFTSETGWARIHRCLDLGASAYVEKAISIGRLPEFITRVHEHNELLIFTAEELPKIQFSKRQQEIMHFIADGKENDEIASILNIDVKTVQSYVNEIKGKLSEAFSIHPIRPRTLLLLASKLGFGTKVV